MVPSPVQQSAASLARALAAGGHGPEAPPPAPEPAEPPVLHTAPREGRLVWPYVATLLVGAVAATALTGVSAVGRHPVLLALLVACVVGLDLLRIDVFERINLSPASVPALALAFLFGPVGPLAAELAIAVVRALQRTPAVKWSFDVGALGLAGAAAAGVWAAADAGSTAGMLVAGVLAGLAAYAVTSALLPTVMWLARGERPHSAWREQLAWLWPHYVGFGLLAAAIVEVERRLGPAGLLLFVVPLVLLWVGEQQYLSRSRAGVQALRERNAQLEAAHGRISELLEHAHVSYLQAITTLGHALQARDPDAAGRTERVTQLSRVIGEELALAANDLDALTIAVVLHDIGRVLLRRGEDPALVPELSAQILDPLDVPEIVKQTARHHLDRCDGPGGAESVPLAARIVAVADALDAATSPSADRDALPLQAARAQLRDEAGRRFCPRVVAALEHALSGDPSLRRYFGERSGDGLLRVA